MSDRAAAQARKEADRLAAMTALIKANGPLTYVELATAMQAAGWEYTGKGNVPNYVYAILYEDVSKQGDASEFRFLKRGRFCLVDQVAALKEAPAQPKAKTKEEAKADETVARLCGNCANMEYAGIQIVKLESGTCANWEKTDRLAVQTTEAACPHFRARSSTTKTTERQRAERLLRVLRPVNVAIQSGRGYDGKDLAKALEKVL